MCWSLPFVTRIFIDIPTSNTISLKFIEDNSISIVDKIIQALSQNDNKSAFLLIFKNNMKGCFLNIVGGITLGIGTVVNLSVNGFSLSDIIVNSYHSGLSMENIFKMILPHSFELIGLWLSGAIGFIITWEIIKFMRGQNVFTVSFIKQVVLLITIIFFITLLAAYVEVYISINELK